MATHDSSFLEGQGELVPKGKDLQRETSEFPIQVSTLLPTTELLIPKAPHKISLKWPDNSNN